MFIGKHHAPLRYNTCPAWPSTPLPAFVRNHTLHFVVHTLRHCSDTKFVAVEVPNRDKLPSLLRFLSKDLRALSLQVSLHLACPASITCLSRIHHLPAFYIQGLNSPTDFGFSFFRGCWHCNGSRTHALLAGLFLLSVTDGVCTTCQAVSLSGLLGLDSSSFHAQRGTT